MDTIWVKAAQSDRVGIWERDDRHPGGEVFVAGDAIVEVARTSLVEDKLRIHDLVQVEPPIHTEKEG